MADRYAGIFLPVTLATAGLAWALSGDPVRALAVVVVATPCPLILAAPIALVSGLSRAARNGVIVKGAGAIETLGQARTVLFDKTGTLTVGTPDVQDMVALGERSLADVLRLAASVDRLSAHVDRGSHPRRFPNRARLRRGHVVPERRSRPDRPARVAPGLSRLPQQVLLGRVGPCA